MYHGENEQFLKIEFPMGWRTIFFCFFSKKVVIIYHGENTLFFVNEITNGVNKLFLCFFFRNKLAIYTMGKTCVSYIRIVFVCFPIGNTIQKSMEPGVRILETTKIFNGVDTSHSDRHIGNVHALIISKEHTFESFKYGTHQMFHGVVSDIADTFYMS